MSDATISGILTTVATGGLALLMLYLGVTALPAFLGLAGVLPRPAGPAPIADALARLTLAGVCFVGIIGIEKLEQRFASGET
jgi:hypothetical protein